MHVQRRAARTPARARLSRARECPAPAARGRPLDAARSIRARASAPLPRAHAAPQTCPRGARHRDLLPFSRAPTAADCRAPRRSCRYLNGSSPIHGRTPRNPQIHRSIEFLFVVSNDTSTRSCLSNVNIPTVTIVSANRRTEHFGIANSLATRTERGDVCEGLLLS